MEVYPKENEAVEIYTDLVAVDGKRLFTSQGYLDEIIIKTLGMKTGKNEGRFKVTVERME